jgi:ferredoxin
MSVCPYKAITENVRPCMRGCKAGAISIDENKKAKISREKCIDCGACVPVCPVSAIFALDDLPEKWQHFAERNAAHYQRETRR